MSAKDLDTSAEQRITISESSNLESSEIERMIADAERHRKEDARLREIIDARNELDSAVYQVKRRLRELGGAVAPHEKARAEILAADASQALKEDVPIARLRSLTSELLPGLTALGHLAEEARARRSAEQGGTARTTTSSTASSPPSDAAWSISARGALTRVGAACGEEASPDRKGPV